MSYVQIGRAVFCEACNEYLGQEHDGGSVIHVRCPGCLRLDRAEAIADRLIAALDSVSMAEQEEP